MKNPVHQIVKKMLAIVAMLTITTSLHASNWTGTWSTSFGEISINSKQLSNIVANMGDYVLKGSISSDAIQKDNIFSGTYMLKPNLKKTTTEIQHYSTLGPKGKFSFVLDATNQKYQGTFTNTQTNRDGFWTGSKIITAKTTTKKVESIRGKPIPQVKIEPVLWTGTWNTNKMGQIKIKWYSEDRIEAKLLFKSGDYIRTAELKGGKISGLAGYNNKYAFAGPYKDTDGKEGFFYFQLNSKNPTLNTFTGYIMIKDKKHRDGQLDNYSPYNINGITGTRTSSTEPDMSWNP